MTDLNRLRHLAGILNESINPVQKVDGNWTDGTYTHGDPVVINGQGMNLEWDPESESWWAIGDDGDEIEFDPGMEDRHDPQYNPYVKKEGLEEESIEEDMELEEETVRNLMANVQDMAERIESIAKKNGRLHQAIIDLGGDATPLKDLIQAADDLYRASEEVEYNALAHRTPRE